MATGFPTKANWSAGDVLTASGMDDLAGTLNYLSPVGQANGSTLVANSANASGLGWNQNFAAGKNKIINGDFNVNQRTFTTTTTDSTYGFDRWQMLTNSATGTTTYSAQTFTPGAAPVAGYEATNFARLVTTGQTGADAYSFLCQKIEDVRAFAGQTMTFSFWAKAASGTPKVAISAIQNFGTGGSPSSIVITNGGTVTLSTSWARYSVTIAVPSISGKTIGTTANSSYLRLDLWVSGGSDYSQAQSIGIQSNTFDIWGVQAEAGSVATAFQTATGTLQGELAACQRYFYATTGLSSNPIAQASYYSTTAAYCLVPLPVTMRTTPSATFQAATNYTIYANSTNKVGSAIALDSPVSTTIATVILTTAAATAGFAGWLASASGSANGYIQLSAEL